MLALGAGGLSVFLPALAQQEKRVRHIGVLTAIAASDPEAKPRITALKQELQKRRTSGFAEGSLLVAASSKCRRTRILSSETGSSA